MAVLGEMDLYMRLFFCYFVDIYEFQVGCFIVVIVGYFWINRKVYLSVVGIYRYFQDGRYGISIGLCRLIECQV